jgi:hypothetical protein
MDRKVKQSHLDKPGHQRWLYKLSDMHLFKAIALIWLICLLAIAFSLLLAKAVISFFK